MTITYVLIGITVIASLYTFQKQELFYKLVFWPYRIWRNNEWYRVLSGGFIHADMNHLIFNMIALFSFGTFVEYAFQQVFPGTGLVIYITMYIVAIAIADVVNLFMKRDNPDYRSLGASGGVSAIIFASILLNPFSEIGILFIPIGIPAYIFGVLYLFYCAYMARRGMDNIGHMAHFTGAIFGFFLPVVLQPALLTRFISLVSSKIGL